MIDKTLSLVEKEVSPLARRAQALIINSLGTMKDAVVFLSVLNKKLDSITEEKERITRPLNEALKVERGRWKPIDMAITSAIAAVRTAMTIYQTEQIRCAKEQELKIAARIGEGRGYLKTETAIKKFGEIERVNKEVSSDEGLVQFRATKKFEVMDMSLLPQEYHIADDVKIREAMKNGVELKGVRYYTEQIVVNYR